jgi:acetyl/propionyl-CoA carboxylase alpha subunit
VFSGNRQFGEYFKHEPLFTKKDSISQGQELVCETGCLPGRDALLQCTRDADKAEEDDMEVKLSGLEEDAEAKVSFWYFDEGEHVDEGEDLAEMATDKAVFNVPAPVAGTLTKICVKEGESAGNDDVVAVIEED